MRPLSDRLPKPLLPVAGKPLVVHHLERLANFGFHDIVINLSYLGEQIKALLGNGMAWGLNIEHSHEPPGALESAGGIAHALPLLDTGNVDQPFLVVNADIYCDWSFNLALSALPDWAIANLVMADNPPHHPQGDFFLDQGKISDTPSDATSVRLCFSGIGIYRPTLFASIRPGHSAPLAPLLKSACKNGLVSGERHRGRWTDVGTPERLAALDVELNKLCPR